jgi:hypothetical protein
MILILVQARSVQNLPWSFIRTVKAASKLYNVSTKLENNEDLRLKGNIESNLLPSNSSWKFELETKAERQKKLV